MSEENNTGTEKIPSAELTGATTPLILLEDDGTKVEFACSRFSDRDWDELDEWLAIHLIHMARRAISPDSSPQERDKEIAIAQKTALGIYILTQDGSEVLNTPVGISRIVLQLCKKNHKDITHQELMRFFRGNCNDNDNIKSVSIIHKRFHLKKVDDSKNP